MLDVWATGRDTRDRQGFAPMNNRDPFTPLLETARTELRGLQLAMGDPDPKKAALARRCAQLCAEIVATLERQASTTVFEEGE